MKEWFLGHPVNLYFLPQDLELIRIGRKCDNIGLDMLI